MIGYLKGEILDHSDGKMLVCIGDRKTTGSVGYQVSVPQSAAYGALVNGQTTELFVHTHVREDAFDLYGFTTKFEKTLFLTLLGVTGIGPKSALGILSRVDGQQLVDAIINEDQALLTHVPGIGKKTAERVIVELKDTVKKKMEAGQLSPVPTEKPEDKLATPHSDLGPATGAMADRGIYSSAFQDAKAALLGLGYREQEVHFLLTRVLKENDSQPRRAEDLIRTALKQLAE